jgi:hypothetical protein
VGDVVPLRYPKPAREAQIAAQRTKPWYRKRVENSLRDREGDEAELNQDARVEDTVATEPTRAL